jgi:hypothetical protein
MIIGSSKDSQVSNFSFNREGGAIAQYPTGIYVDEFSFFTGLSWAVITDFVGDGGNASISVYLAYSNLSSPPVLISTSNLMTAGTYQFIAAPLRLAAACQLIVAINDFPITAGELNIYADYFNTDL